MDGGALSGEIETFKRDGFLAPVGVLTRSQCALILRHEASHSGPRPPVWFKARAASDRFLYDVATRPALAQRLGALLGPDVVLWGASFVHRSPGQVHTWHTDIESAAPDGRFVSVWIGLDNTSRESSLKLVSGSHAIGVTVQEALFQRGLRRARVEDDEVLALARERDPSAAMIQPDVGDGEAIFFDGRLWHASHNTRIAGSRSALLLQYAAAASPVRMFDTAYTEWPFRMIEDRRPPVVSVSGRADARANDVVPVPGLTTARAEPLTALLQDLALPLAEDRDKGWRPYPVFAGPTPVIGHMGCHVSVLSPGRTPHPPHAHLEEELLVVLDGEADLVVAESADDPGPRVERVTAGSFAYYPAFQHHTIRNPGTKPVTYLMLRWRGAPVENADPLTTRIVCASAPDAAPHPRPFASTLLFEQETAYLGKLHGHRTVLQPGAGYEPHRDAYDVALVLLSGRVASLDGEAGPFGAVYYAAGEPHGISNVGAEPARYLAFEFHAATPARPGPLRANGSARAAPRSTAAILVARLRLLAAAPLRRSREIVELRRGRKLLAGSPLFDRDWYLKRYPDVARAGLDPVAHYLRFGAAEGRDPGPEFDGDGYLARYPDVRRARANPLVHYLMHGRQEGRVATPVAPAGRAASRGRDELE